jgi:hypothetical protein
LRTKHLDGEKIPPADAVRALGQWLDANGHRQAELEALGLLQTQVSRLFRGSAYLSATHRRALEAFTGGVITARALEGAERPPKHIPSKAGPLLAHLRLAAPMPAPAPESSEEPAEPEPEPPPDPQVQADRKRGVPQSPEEAERMVDDLALRAMPAAFRLIVQQMVQAKSEAERRRCAEILIDHLRGKAKQYEKRDAVEPPATDDELLLTLGRIEKNLKAQ